MSFQPDVPQAPESVSIYPQKGFEVKQEGGRGGKANEQTVLSVDKESLTAVWE